MDNLTFGDIFKIFPRLPSVKTPEVNRKIIVPSGITPLKNADQFRVIYKEEMLDGMFSWNLSLELDNI